jgi:hypothetical protein
MTTSEAGQGPLTLPVNRIFAVFDDPANADRAVAALEAEWPVADTRVLCCDAALNRIDARGAHGGALHRVIRAVQGIGIEGTHMQRYEDEITRGHFVLETVAPPSADERAALLKTLKAHGAHFINLYGRWTVEGLAP